MSSTTQLAEVASSSKRKFLNSEEEYLPAFLRDDEIIAPLKCDVTMAGARYVDTFSWNIYNSAISPDEFASRTCADLNLPPGFQVKIALQVEEQVNGYRELVQTVHKFAQSKHIRSLWASKIKEPLLITIGIRHNTLDFADKFYWDLGSNDVTPEQLARTTCSDLGLPGDMEPAIAHKVRETLFRLVCTWMDDPKILEVTRKVEVKPSEVKVLLVSAGSSVDMLANLWKRARPASVDDCASVPQPMLPANKDTNAHVWRS